MKPASSLIAVSLAAVLSAYSTPALAADENVPSPQWTELERSAAAAYKRGDLDEAERLWRDALKQADTDALIEPGTVNCLCGLAFVYDRRGNGAEAERLYELAMRNMEGLVGPQSTRFADWMPNLAFMYDAHGRPDRAEVLFKKALRIKERAYGADDVRVAEVLDQYARFLRKNGRATEANELLQRARSIREKAGP